MSEKKPLYTRREFLQTAGAAAGFALPFMKSAVAMGQTSTAPVRLLIVPLQHGWGLGRTIAQRPAFASRDITGTETNFNLPSFFGSVFNPIKDQMVMLDGIRTYCFGNAHDTNYANMLTGAQPYVPDGNIPMAFGGPFGVPRGPSIDWVLGNALNKGVLRFSNGYASFGANYHPLSFDSSIRNLPYYTNARAAYMDIIDPLRQGQPATSPSVVASRNALMAVLGKNTDRLLSMLVGSERAKMESYLAAMNSLGNRLLAQGGPSIGSVTLPAQPAQTLTYEQSLDAYLEMIRVAFTLDTHRIAVLGLGEHQLTNWAWTSSAGAARTGNPSATDYHHGVAHWGTSIEGAVAESRYAFEGSLQWYYRKIVNFVNTLNGITDVDGKKLLDNTIIVLTGEISDGEHDTNFTVWPIIGGGGGRIRKGRWLRYPQAVNWREMDAAGNVHTFTTNGYNPAASRSVNDLWVSIARLMGHNISTFGHSVNNTVPIELV